MIVAVIDSTQVTVTTHTHTPSQHIHATRSLCVHVCVQLQELMCHVMMGTLVMFRKDSVLNILSEEHSYTAWTALSSACPHDLYPFLVFF